MKKALGGILCAVLASTPAFAQASGADETVRRLASGAQEELANSNKELSALQDRIAAEKLPLAQELTELEKKVSQLRRDQEERARAVDAGSLELVNLRKEIKARQDEMAYVGGLLDEYARTFDSKVNISELQRVGESLSAAKLATENKSLSMSERFARQVAFVDVSLARLADAIGGMRFAGQGVDMQGAVADGQFAIIGPVALFHSKASGAAGVVVQQPGTDKPLIRPLEGSLQANIATLVESGQGTLPLDPSRGAALKALVQKTNLVHIFEKGGPIMWPLLVTSILALGTVVERFLFLLVERWRRSRKALDRFFAAVTQGRIDEAIRIGKSTRFFVVRALGYALAHRETSLEGALLYAQAQELKRFERGVPILDTVITLAPLLGLLGTVTGMMGSFSLIGGELGAPGAITGGIAEALIATAFGLGIAITALLPFNYLNARVEEARHEMESAATQLELLIRPSMAMPDAVAADALAGPDGRRNTDGLELRDADVQRSRELQLRREHLRRELEALNSEIAGGQRGPQDGVGRAAEVGQELAGRSS